MLNNLAIYTGAQKRRRLRRLHSLVAGHFYVKTHRRNA
jgi:hypothetical protein